MKALIRVAIYSKLWNFSYILPNQSVAAMLSLYQSVGQVFIQVFLTLFIQHRNRNPIFRSGLLRV